MEDLMVFGKRLFETTMAMDTDEALRMAMEAKETKAKRFVILDDEFSTMKNVACWIGW